MPGASKASYNPAHASNKKESKSSSTEIISINYSSEVSTQLAIQDIITRRGIRAGREWTLVNPETEDFKLFKDVLDDAKNAQKGSKELDDLNLEGGHVVRWWVRYSNQRQTPGWNTPRLYYVKFELSKEG